MFTKKDSLAAKNGKMKVSILDRFAICYQDGDKKRTFGYEPLFDIEKPIYCVIIKGSYHWDAPFDSEAITKEQLTIIKKHITDALTILGVKAIIDDE